MEQPQRTEAMDEPARVEPCGSSLVSHRRGERMRTYRYQPRPEARM